MTGACSIGGRSNIGAASNIAGASNIGEASRSAPIRGGIGRIRSLSWSTNFPKSNRAPLALFDSDAPAGTFVLMMLSLRFLPPILNFGVSVRCDTDDFLARPGASGDGDDDDKLRTVTGELGTGMPLIETGIPLIDGPAIPKSAGFAVGSGGTGSSYFGDRFAREPRLDTDLRKSVGERGESGVPLREIIELIWSDSVANDPRRFTTLAGAGDAGTSSASDMIVEVRLGLRACRFSGVGRRRDAELAAAAA